MPAKFVGTMPEWMKDINRRLRRLERRNWPQTTTTPVVLSDGTFRLRFPAGSVLTVEGSDVLVAPPNAPDPPLPADDTEGPGA